MNLCFDCGNTQIKVFYFNETKLLKTKVLPAFTKKELNKAIKAGPVKNIIISSVISEPAWFESLLQKRADYFLRLSHKTKLPVKIKYKTPTTLGMDRLANISGGTSLCPKKNVLIIDAGTCIKYDFADASGNYFGGAISPGINMRFKALNNYTDRLPLAKQSGNFPICGNSTRSSILSGVQNGVIFEINSFINSYHTQFNKIKVILTGGDACFLSGHINFPIFVAPDLTGIGLNEILRFNVAKNL